MKQKTLLLVRHAHTPMEGRFCGHSDPELSDRGRRQLPAIVEQLGDRYISGVYSSDLLRARQTAEPIASKFGLAIEVRPSLREIDFGAWEGLSWSEIEQRDSAFAAAWMADFPQRTSPGGETFNDFERRVKEELSAFANTEGEGCWVGVTHAGFIQASLSLVRRVAFRSIANVAYGAVVALSLTEEGWIG
ncbi:MAG TPA: histidine phosphatase family protein [Candidatus Angelobacter sp.]|nr:histidine phosphatase family protein [Candidatus Angelobacter sp.]